MMQLKIILPTNVFLDARDVQQIIVDTPHGAYGLLPRRLDCAAAVVPGILTYKNFEGLEIFVAVDEGVMVKHNQLVTVAVRRAFKGDDLTELKEQINEHFLQQGEAQERHRRLQQRLESGFLRRFADFRHA